MINVRKMSYLFSLLISLCFVVSLIFPGCGGGESATVSGNNTGTPYTYKALPEKFSIVMPKSLISVQPAAKSLKTSKATAGTQPSYGYMMLKKMVNEFESEICYNEINFMLIDAGFENILSHLSGNKAELPENAYKVTWTQEMSNKEKELFQKLNMPLTGLTPVGEQIPSPRLTYIKDDTDSDNDGYHHTMTFYFNDSQENSIYTMKWNKLRNKLLVSETYTCTIQVQDPNNPQNINTVKYEGTYKCIYDNTDGKAKMSILSSDKSSDNMYNYAFSFSETGSNNGVILSLSTQANYGTNRYISEIEGIADDNGGYVKTLVNGPLNDYSTNPPTVKEQTLHYRESFDGTGAITGAQYSSDGTAWNNMPDYPQYNSTSYETTYTAINTAQSSIKITISGFTAVEGTDYIILPAGTPTANPATIEAKNELCSKAIGYATLIKNNTGNNEWLTEFWGTEAQVSGAVVFSVTYNSANEISYSHVQGATISKAAP